MATAALPGYNKGTYTFEQQAFSLSWSTVLSFNIAGEAEEIAVQVKTQVEKLLGDPEIRQLLGTWTLAWGPAVFADSFTGKKEALNTMYILVPAEDPEQALVAIAGTNGTSLMDWIVEDFNVSETVHWPYNSSPEAGRISKGTAFGLDKLVNMTAASSQGTAAISAREFLGKGGFKKVLVTGHSLGGALSPCYSLYLDETRVAWDTTGTIAISVFPTAGATPGDADFSRYYGDRLGSATKRVWNSLDPVPRAFNVETLAPIPTMYEPELSSDLIRKLVGWVQRSTEKHHYTNILPETEGFPSHFYSIDEIAGKNKPIVDEIRKVAKMLQKVLLPYEWDAGTAIAFIVQALIQHTIGYLAYFDVGAFAQRMSVVTSQATPVVSEDDSVALRLHKLLTALGNEPILLDLGHRRPSMVSELKRGEGPLLESILEKVETLNEGKPHAGAQTVIFLVEEEQELFHGWFGWDRNGK
ncbi:MAG: hypothetical protein JNK87_29095 [Bryobacterales bacterium]|nr:hypothetical protein [Bryobacterales bacterium]